MEIKVQLLFLGVVVTLVEFFLITCFAVPDEYIFRTMINPSVVFTHEHVSDIGKHCSSFLSSASELIPDDQTRFRLQDDLSFQNGDWKQEPGGVPFMPFLDSEISKQIPYLPTPLKLASFDIKDVSPTQHFRNSVTMRGHLSIGMSKESLFLDEFNRKNNFIRPGSSVLTFSFDGVYTETAQERYLCLLGNSTASSNIYFEDIPNFPKGFDFHQYDKVFLVLRYPQVFKLNKRAILGELRCLNEEANIKCFDTVYIYSVLGRQTRYEFGSKVLESSCNLKLNYREMIEDGAEEFTSSEMGTMLDYASGKAISIFPNYRFGGRYLIGNELGDLLFGKEFEDVGTSYENVKLVLQHVKCEYNTSDGSYVAAKVSAVLRAIPAGVDPNIAQTLTGLSGLTLIAEGIWDPSSGQVCMIGCPGVIDSGLEGCNSKISLYFPRSFSIKQRSIVFGSISSLKDGVYSEFNLQFDAVVHPTILLDAFYRYSFDYLAYNYSMFSLASAFKRRRQPFQIFTNLKRSILKYPSLEDKEEPFAELERLSDMLLVDGYIVPDQLPDNYYTRITIKMEVLSLGPLLGRFCRECSNQIAANRQAKFTSTDILNVSTHLVFREIKQTDYSVTITSYKNISQLSLEGLYDPLVGEMHLIGCRKTAIGRTSTKRDLDCSIEVNVQYPSDNIEWLVNPIVELTITSQRNEQDPLHFSPISIHARMSNYHSTSETAAQRRKFEGNFQIFILAMAVAIISSQLCYMREQEDTVPFVSRTMLGLQALGYSLPLINGSAKYSDPRYMMLSNAVDIVGRAILLSALILTARLLRMVSDSRNNKQSGRTRGGKMLKDKLVLFISLTTYALGFLLWVVNDNNHSQQLESQKNAYKSAEMIVEEIWMRNMEELVMMVQDFFLLPQVVSNLYRQIHVKSLRKSYYIGYTLLRLLVHLYDYVRDPILDSQFQEIELATSMFREISVATIIVMLAAVLHIQQNRKNKKLMSLSLNKSLED